MSITGPSPGVLLTVEEGALHHTVRDFLRGYGVERVGAYPNPKEAVSQLQDNSEKWDVFILDGSIPGALERVQQVRKELKSSIQTLVILSDPTQEEIVEAIKVGVNSFLATPFSQQTFENQLGAMFNRRANF